MIALCPLEALENFQSKGFELGERAIFVVRQNHQVFAYHNRCPHLGIQLEWQPDRFLDVDGELIQCATHGALFTVEDGLCVSGPCGGQSLQAIETRILDGQVWLKL